MAIYNSSGKELKANYIVLYGTNEVNITSGNFSNYQEVPFSTVKNSYGDNFELSNYKVSVNTACTVEISGAVNTSLANDMFQVKVMKNSEELLIVDHPISTNMASIVIPSIITEVSAGDTIYLIMSYNNTNTHIVRLHRSRLVVKEI